MPKTLLLADDSVTIQKVVGISFASEDVTLVTVDNGDDAIARAKESKPDLILADVVMPGKNGYEVCEAVKADPELSHIPVLLLTGTFEAFDEERAARAGAAGHVSKPFEAQTLVDQAKRLLAETTAPAAAPAAPTPPPIAEATPVPAASAPPTTAGETPVPDATPVPGRSAMDTVPPAPAIEDSFDFFDDDVKGLASKTAPPAGDAPGTSGGLDLESSDSAFAFGEAEVTPMEPAPQPLAVAPLGEMSAGDRTVAILPDEMEAVATAEPAPLGDALASFGDDDLSPLGTALEGAAPDGPSDSDSLGPISSAAPSAASDFDFDFETPPPVEPMIPDAPVAPLAPEALEAPQAEPLVPVDAADLAQATILDPNGASGYDVSSSDLGDPLAIGPSAPRSSASGPASDPSAISAPTAPPADVDLDVEPRLGAPEVEPAPEPVAPPLPSLGATPPPLPDLGDTGPAILAGPGNGAETPPITFGSMASLPEVEPEPFATIEPEPASMAASADAMTADALEQLTPKLRAQLHDTLEKIAWESFSDLTETIVRQAVERVEQVAWEVIPQLAETLVREEIRRMKGDDDS